MSIETEVISNEKSLKYILKGIDTYRERRINFIKSGLKYILKGIDTKISSSLSLTGDKFEIYP